MRLLVFLTCALCTLAASGAVYKWVDANGHITYSDQPQHPSAQPLALPDVQTFHPGNPAPANGNKGGNNTPPPPPEDAGYQSLSIVQPQNDATIRNNAGNITIQLDLTPELKGDQGHSVVLLVDGKRAGTGRGMVYTIQDLDRGTHTIQASVENSTGQTLLTSDAVVFHLFRTAVHSKN